MLVHPVDVRVFFPASMGGKRDRDRELWSMDSRAIVKDLFFKKISFFWSDASQAYEFC